MFSTYSAASEDLALGSNVLECELSPSAKLILIAAECSPSMVRAYPAMKTCESLPPHGSQQMELPSMQMRGGFPCQDVSIANVTGQGLAGARSGLWFDQYARLIGELRPRVVIIENVAELLNRGMGGSRIAGRARV